ncbi:MAG: 4-carboxymuconolactone decarboxylase, partial [Bradyrhizobium sp.]|nr:4-carboxymuconolactone decarboxylase [Bradyrhizobium sp.]
MDTNELYERGLRRRKKLFGEAEVGKRMAAAGEFGAPLQTVINAYVYGDIWERQGLSDAMRSLVMLGITAASNRPAEFRVHAKGALANGCSKAQVQDVLLLVA